MPAIREYLVSLGAEVDNKSFNKFNAALKGANKNALAFSAAMAALMAMVAKTSISLDKTTQKYEEMAKKQKKSVADIRAQEEALKIVGKNLKEIENDQTLKKHYDELKKIGEELALPTASAGEKSLRGLLQDFDKFRMVGSYAMNMINHEFLKKIQAPMEEVRRNLSRFTDKLKYNLPRISDSVGQVFANMFRLVMAGVNALSNMAGKFEKLLPYIAPIGGALLAAFGGPVVVAIGTVLALLDDYQTYLRGGESALNGLWEAMENGTAVEYLLGEFGKIPGKIKEINEQISGFLKDAFRSGELWAQEVLKGISEHDFSQEGAKIAQFFGSLVNEFLDFINLNMVNGTSFFDSIVAVGGSIVGGLAEAMGTAIADFPWEDTLLNLMHGANNLLTIIGDVLFGSESTDANGNAVKYEGLVDTFKGAAKNLVGGIMTAVTSLGTSDLTTELTEFLNGIGELIGKAFSPENIGDVFDTIAGLGTAGSELARKVIEIVGNSFEKLEAAEVGQKIGDGFNALMGKISEWMGIAALDLPYTASKMQTGLKQVGGAFVEMLSAAFSTMKLSDGDGSLKGAISSVLNTIVSLIAQAADPATIGQLMDDAGQMVNLGIDVALGIAEAILGAFAKIPYEKLGASIGGAINTLFSKIGEFITKANDSQGGKSFADRMGDLAGLAIEIAQGIVTAISTAFGQIDLGHVKDDVKAMFDGLFAVIGKVFSKENAADVVTLFSSVVELGKNIALGLIGALGDSFTALSTDANAAQNITEVFNNILTVIGGIFSKENVGSVKDVFVGVANFGKNVVLGLIGALGNLFSGMGSDEETSGEAKGIFESLLSTLGDIFKNLTGDDVQTIFTSITGFGASVISGLLGALGQAVSGITPANVSGTNGEGGLKSIVDGVFGLIGQFLTPENIKTAMDVMSNGISLGTSIVTSIISGIGNIFAGGVDLGKVTGPMSTLVTELMRTIASALTDFLKKDEETGKSKVELASEGVVSIFTGIVDSVASGLSGIEFGDLSAQFGQIVAKIFQLIREVFSPTNISKLTDSGISLINIGKDIAMQMLSSIRTGFSQLNLANSGATFGGIVETVFKKLTTFLRQQIVSNQNGQSLLGEFGKTAYTLASGIIEMIGSAIGTLADGKVAEELGTNLIKFITSSIDDFVNKMQEGDIDVAALGAKIGEAIGSAITISTDFLDNFITGALDWLSSGGMEKLGFIGESILAGLMNAAGGALSELAKLLGIDLDYKPVTTEQIIAERDRNKKYEESKQAINQWRDEQARLNNNFFTDTETQYTFYDENGNPKKMTLGDIWGYQASAHGKNDVPLFPYNPATTPIEQQVGTNVSAPPISTSGGTQGLLKGLLGVANTSIPLELLVNANTDEAAAKIAALQAEAEKGATKKVSVFYEVGSDPDVDISFTPKALGGRFSTATRGVFGEDGTEYIIPITKPARAKALIMQMFKEMGAGASSILNELGASGSGAGIGGPGSAWSSQPAAMYPQVGGGMKSNSDNNVNVPTTINVYGSGDPIMAGNAAANASRSNVLRSVRGVLGA